MVQWQDIPYEVKIEIVKEAKDKEARDDEDEGTWTWADRQMYTTYQSFEFEEVSIDFNRKEQKYYNSIKNSCFKRGRWVKYLTLENLPVPQDLQEIDPATDPTYTQG